MIAFVIRRLVQSLFVMLAVALVAFLVFQFIGDPVSAIVGQDATPEQRLELRRQLGLDDPVPLQFAKFVAKAVQGDFGLSYQYARPVSDIIVERLPATLELSFVAATLALLVGVALGVFTGLNRETVVSKVLMAVSLLGVSLPPFLVGILLIVIFSVVLGWLPSFGRGPTVKIGAWTTGFLTVDGWRSLILPAVTLGLFQLTLIMRLVRAEMLEVLRTDYIKFARARGLPRRAINFGHALRNTLIPVITIAGLQLGSIIAFAIITETVFQWPGVGLLFIQAIYAVDIPVMSAYLVFVALVFVIINFVVDCLYHVVDPRLRVDRGAAGGHGH